MEKKKTQKIKNKTEEAKLWRCKIEGCNFGSTIPSQVVTHSKVMKHNEFEQKPTSLVFDDLTEITIRGKGNQA